MTTAYPHAWPDTMPRARTREAGQFKTSLAGALKNVEDSLRKFGHDAGRPVSNIILSSNVTLGTSRPEDPGIAVWFTWEDQQLCIAVDRYKTAEANLQAIHHIIEARRVELRHGTLNLVRASFQGFKALPSAPGSHWTEVLGLPPNATAEQIRAAHKAKAQESHPDRGGSTQAMSKINAARDRALKELGDA